MHRTVIHSRRYPGDYRVSVERVWDRKTRRHRHQVVLDKNAIIQQETPLGTRDQAAVDFIEICQRVEGTLARTTQTAST